MDKIHEKRKMKYDKKNDTGSLCEDFLVKLLFRLDTYEHDFDFVNVCTVGMTCPFRPQVQGYLPAKAGGAAL